jgi:hypothetical protein
MTNKEICLDVALKGEWIGNVRSCRLCKLYHDTRAWKECQGCFLADKKGNCGCDIIEDALDERPIEQGNKYLKKKGEEAYKILLRIPERRFTKSGWKYFKELDKLRKQIKEWGRYETKSDLT